MAFGERHYFGCFDDKRAAAEKYNQEVMRLHGAFAKLNEIAA
jgi:hypothetical protein